VVWLIRPCAVVGKHVRGDWVKAWSRSALYDPRGAKPKGASGDVRAKRAVRRKGLLKGLKPRNRGSSGRPLLRRGNTDGVNGTWVQPSGNRRLPFTRRKLRRGIPGALPVRNNTGPVTKGVNRQAGSQTRKMERGGKASPAENGSSWLAGAVGNQSS
jgi:hypothetical protein